MAAMMYNQNNVATEASPVTTDLEKQVGDQLCRMLGYAGSNPPKGLPASWGHITCVRGCLHNTPLSFSIKYLII